MSVGQAGGDEESGQSNAWRGYGHRPDGPGLPGIPPDMVYVPAHPARRRDDVNGTIEFEVRELADGSRVLPVFSSVDRMAEALGPAQPWALVPLRAARAVMAIAGIQSVVLDPELADDAWRWDASSLRRLAGAA
jgi:SseB protein N-terminal domain